MLSGFELYSRWVPLTFEQKNHTGMNPPFQLAIFTYSPMLIKNQLNSPFIEFIHTVICIY